MRHEIFLGEGVHDGVLYIFFVEGGHVGAWNIFLEKVCGWVLYIFFWRVLVGHGISFLEEGRGGGCVSIF